MEQLNLSLNSNINSYPMGEYYPYYPTLQPLVQTYYPTYYPYWNDDSKIEQAFKISQKLIEKKLVKMQTVKDFIELVNEIASVI